MRTVTLSTFERAVLDWIGLVVKDPTLDEQLATAQVSRREHTGVGCYSSLVVAPDSPASDATYASRGPLPGPQFESQALEHGGGTLLWFESGRVACLETYTYADSFPVNHAELEPFVLLSEARTDDVDA